MTNREKYNFDYFTIKNYKRQLELAQKNNFVFVKFSDKDLLQKGRKELLWRHDVEFSPDIALKMAKIENELNIKATYFFQLHSEFYNLLEMHFSNILLEIQKLGHEIGLHFDAHYYKINREEDLNYFINLDKEYFEKIFKLELKTFSFHNTDKFILSCTDFNYGGLINVYSSYFKDMFNYCADSTGYWRYEVLEERLKDKTIDYLQVLTHDAMWSTQILSPRKRVRKAIQENCDRVKKTYDKILIDFKAHNIDD